MTKRRYWPNDGTEPVLPEKVYAVWSKCADNSFLLEYCETLPDCYELGPGEAALVGRYALMESGPLEVDVGIGRSK